MVSESGLDSYVGCIRLQSNSNWRDNMEIVSTHYINLITMSPKSRWRYLYFLKFPLYWSIRYALLDWHRNNLVNFLWAMGTGKGIRNRLSWVLFVLSSPCGMTPAMSQEGTALPSSVERWLRCWALTDQE